MKQNFKIVAIVLVALLAGASLGHLFTEKRNTAYEQLLEGVAFHERKEVERYKQETIYWQRRDSVWQSVSNQYADSLKVTRAQKAKPLYIYENIGHVAAPDYSEPELDALISAIIK